MLKPNDQPRRLWTPAHWTRRGLAVAFAGGLAIGSAATALLVRDGSQPATLIATAGPAPTTTTDALASAVALAVADPGRGPASAPPSSPSTTTTAPRTIDSTAIDSSVTARCARTETPLSPAPATIDAFRSTLVRRWLLCGHPSVFGSNDDAGIELAADGSWFKLISRPDGTVQRAAGFGARGSWEIIDTSLMNGKPTFQLNLSIFGSGTVITQPQFAGDPLKMRLNNMGVFIGDYVAE